MAGRGGTRKVSMELGPWEGLDVASTWSQLPLNALTDCLNYHIDDAGGLVQRWGNYGLSHASGGVTPSRYFMSEALGNTLFVQEGSSLVKYVFQPNAGSPVTSGRTVVATFTTGTACALIDFAGKVVVVHPVDGVFDYDGTTWTSRNTTVKGTTITAWQNKCWVGGDSSNPSRVWWSNIGSSATWTTASDFNELRDQNNFIITSIRPLPGMDEQGRGGLIVCKRFSSYRIYDSATGAYTTIDPSHGAVGHESVRVIGQVVGILSTEGFFLTDGFDPLTNVSKAVAPLFRAGVADHSGFPQRWVLGHYYDRFMMVMPSRQGTANYMWLEYTPDLSGESAGSWMLHQNASANIAHQSFTSYNRDGENYHMWLKIGVAGGTIFGVIGKSDDESSSNITYIAEFAPLAVNGSDKFRVRRVLIEGRLDGAGAAGGSVKVRSETANATATVVSDLPLTVGNPDPDARAAVGEIYGLGVHRRFQLRVELTHTTVAGDGDATGIPSLSPQFQWSNGGISKVQVDAIVLSRW